MQTSNQTCKDQEYQRNYPCYKTPISQLNKYKFIIAVAAEIIVLICNKNLHEYHRETRTTSLKLRLAWCCFQRTNAQTDT